MTVHAIEYAARTMPNARVINGGARRIVLLNMSPRCSRDVRIYVQRARRWVRPESYPPPAAGWRHRKGKAPR